MSGSTLGRTPEFAWMMELMQRGFPEIGDKIGADMQIVMSMCKAEPKSAQFTMQSFAEDVRRDSRNPLDPDAAARLPVARFMLGALFLGYCALAVAEQRVPEDQLPPELTHILQRYPEIRQCADELRPNG